MSTVGRENGGVSYPLEKLLHEAKQKSRVSDALSGVEVFQKE